jgi:heat shock protein HslJ
MSFISLVLLIALNSLFAPVMSPVVEASNIAPHAWEMESFTLGNEAPVEVAEPEHYTAQFLPGGQATLRLDCNRGHADFSASDGQLALTNLATTDARCASGSHGDAFGLLLLGAESYRFDDTGHLILRGPQGAILLRPALAGVVWQWQGIADIDGALVVAVMTPERYSLQFLGDGRLAIRVDCNRGSGQTRIDGISMEIRAGGMTRLACQSDSLGDLYLTGLHHVEHWYLFNGVLTLSLPDGAGMMIFRPVVNTGELPPGAE